MTETAKASTTSAPAVIELCNAVVRFGASTAIDDISVRVGAQGRRGEFIAILGPSGCGKSTLLNLVAGFQSPSAGQVLVGGVPVDGPGRDRGMVFQQYSSFPHRTVRENVMFGLEVNGAELGLSRSQRRERAHDLIQQVGLTGHEDKYPHQLSGGQQQRVAIARTLALEPDILLMDEAFSALDEPTRLDMQELVVNLWHRARPTILCVTHSVTEAVYLSERVWIFTKAPGQIAYDIQDCIPPTAGIPPVVAQEQPAFKEGVRIVTEAFRKVIGAQSIEASPATHRALR